MAPLPVLIAALCLAPAAELKVKPTDWPQFRGPNRDGFSAETGLLKKWPENGPPKVWTVAGAGQGYSTVAVVGGLIFGTGKTDGKECIWALDEATGQQKWQTPISSTAEAKRGDGTRSTPTYSKGKLYALASDGTLACVDALTGKLIWQKSYTKDFGGKVQSWAYSESVLVDDGKVIGTPCSSSAAMVALNADTGEVVWKTQVKDAGKSGGYSSPVKAEVGGIPMYVNLLGESGGVVGVHAKTGKLLWRYTEIMNGTANVPNPVVKGDLVFASTGYGAGAALLKLTADGETVSVKELKRHSGGELQNHHGGMVPVGDYIYLGSQHNKGFPACVEFKSGEIKWAEQKGAGRGDGSAATAAADGKLYFRYQNGVVALIEADPEQFKMVSSFKIPEASGSPSWPHPTIANGKLYIRDQDKLHCFDIKAK